ncbi:MAG: phosphatidate cytidylyltransferase [Oceanicoccus sp.]|jgi:phosphatidate cytidylyltransferase
MLKLRIITALVLVSVIGAGIFLLPPQGLALLLAILVTIAAWEWSGLAGLPSVFARSVYSLSVVLLMAVAAWYSQLWTEQLALLRLRELLGVGCLWWSIALLWVMSYPASASIWRLPLIRLVMGWFTLVPAWLALVYLRQHADGIALIFMLIALVAAADIGAYFSGKAWGDRKLAPAVSPAKSWVGFWGGMAASVGLLLVFWFLLGREQYNVFAVVAVAVVTSLASVLGDLVESMVKREQGVKDSGRILPGHGGMMDRLDSMTAAAPVFTLSLILAGW